MGDHTRAYYRDEDVIDFLYPSIKDDDRVRNEIINYQHKIWGKIEPKKEEIKFNNNSIKGGK
ncbi:MAG: hypothetical protein PUJ68_00425 [[Actinobacillus] rossii]|nr:hypothetical protein [[Actinobacillus] rossii]MDY5793320.1 hypothetical protein [[Actinobacillus] rossii]